LKTIVISDEELTKIVDREESHFFDIKQHAGSGKSIQKVAAAFSNADGGELIIGIKDKRTGDTLNERWEGIGDIEQLNGHVQALFEVKPAFSGLDRHKAHRAEGAVHHGDYHSRFGPRQACLPAARRRCFRPLQLPPQYCPASCDP